MNNVKWLDVCEKCGSEDIAKPAWTNRFGDYTEVKHDSKYDWECYCYNCEELVCHTMYPSEEQEVA